MCFFSSFFFLKKISFAKVAALPFSETCPTSSNALMQWCTTSWFQIRNLRPDSSYFEASLKNKLWVENTRSVLAVTPVSGSVSQSALHNSLVCIEFWHKFLLNLLAMNFPWLSFVRPLCCILLYSIFSFSHSFLVQHIFQLLNSFCSIFGILSGKSKLC